MRHQKVFQKLKLPDFNINNQQNLDLPLQSHTTNNAYQLWLHHEYEEWEQQNLWLALSFPTEKIQLCIRSKASQFTGTKKRMKYILILNFHQHMWGIQEGLCELYYDQWQIYGKK